MNKISAMFRSRDGRNLALTFTLVTSLFLLWGFCNGMIDILNKHFQETLHISKFQSGFVQFANYIAYFLMAIPAGLLAKRFGYKGGILIGLALIALGAFWFIPATGIGAYWAFLAGLFIIAAGMTCLETIANPYATLLGPSDSGALRINLAQSFNGIGWILGPVVGGQFVFAGAERSGASGGLYIPYLGVGVVVLILMIVFAFAYVPDLQDEEVVPMDDKGKAVVPITHHRNFVFGVVTQFAYVAAQTGTMSPRAPPRNGSVFMVLVSFFSVGFAEAASSALPNRRRPSPPLPSSTSCSSCLPSRGGEWGSMLSSEPSFSCRSCSRQSLRSASTVWAPMPNSDPPSSSCRSSAVPSPLR
jgi:MFS family permease